MLIIDRVWNRIRDQFTEDEKLELRNRVTGACICPAGNFVDFDSLPENLRDRLMLAIEEDRVR